MVGEVYAGFCWGNQRETVRLKDRGVDGRMMLKCILKTLDGETWNEFLWLSTETGGGRL